MIIISEYTKESSINKKVFIPLLILSIGILGGALYFAGVFDFLLPAEKTPTELQLVELDSIDLSYSEWVVPSQTGYANFKVNPVLTTAEGTEITSLYDTSGSYRAKGTLNFPDIDIGKLKLTMRTYRTVYHGGCNIYFRGDGITIFGIARDSTGMWTFYDGISNINLFLSDCVWHNWYIDWEIDDDTMYISITVDTTIYIDHEEILLSNDIDQILMITSTSETSSWTIFQFENSYLKSYQYS